MFEVGERVVCVDAGPSGWKDFGPDLLTAGNVYVVVGFIAKGAAPTYTSKPLRTGARHDALMVEGVESLGLYAEFGFVFQPFRISRFRKLQTCDTSESLKALKDLTVNCPPLETVGG